MTFDELAKGLGFTRLPGESEDHFLERVQVGLMLLTPRPVTLQQLCDYARIFAGRGARVTGREPGERMVELFLHLPRYRRVFAWQRRRIKQRVWEKVNEVREVNFVITVAIAD